MHIESSSLGFRVSDSRKKLGLSQEALAERANVSLSTIQRIEKGSVKPRPYTLKIIAETLKVEITQLLEVELVKKQMESDELVTLKLINRITLFLAFIPFVSMILPLLVWKLYKQIDSIYLVAGKIVSFQLLWSIATSILSFLSIFLTNLITGEAGNGLYISLIMFSLSIILNIYVIAMTAFQINSGTKSILTKVPNFF